MPSLFEAVAGPAGYRLKLLEVFNWGTFHEGDGGQDIWRLVPDGQNTLLTGSNGSGKTTLVDGLLALLVNHTKRFFNQSSGAESRSGRSEESYVEGHYGRTQDEEKQNTKPEKLRPHQRQTYSILLGVFTNPHSLPITLVQVRWFGTGGMQRKFLVAKAELNIADHIAFGTSTPWVNGLKKQFAPGAVEDFPTFAPYAAAFRRLFGMKEKALTLFNQTVGMKVIGNLDDFIRTNMLEESTAEVEFSKLMGNYQTLLLAHRALEKAKTQLALLRPVHERNHEYEDLQQRLRQTQEDERRLEPWFAQQQIRLWTAETARLDRELDRLGGLLAQQEADLETADEQRVRLAGQIDNDQIGREIKELERQVRELEKSKSTKEQALNSYNRLARQLELVADPDAGLFEANIAQAGAARQATQALQQQLGEQKYAARTAHDAQKTAFEWLEADVAQLQKSTGKVTGRVADIRQEILDAVGASPVDIPFVAEIMQVKPEEKSVWNEALEKLLHSFGRDLLVPEHLYAAVRAHVHHERDLRGKVVFHRVEDKTPRPIFPDARTVVAKLDFNPKSPFAVWAENAVAARFGYVCTEDFATFERADKAVLPSGLIRHKNRHERDDSAAHHHILGWDNRELLREYQRRGRELSAAISQAESNLRRIDQELERAAKREKDQDAFLLFNQFPKLDWQADAHHITQLTRQKEELENKNASLKTLKEQLAALRQAIDKLGKDRERTRDEFKDTEKSLQALTAEQRQQQDLVATFDAADLATPAASLAALTEPVREALTYEQFFGQKQQLERTIAQQLADLHRDKETQEKAIREAMRGFLLPGEEVLSKFTDWHSDTRELRNEMDQLAEYLDRYAQIRNEQLAELETRFRDEFNRGVTKALTDYCQSLETQHEAICDTIDEINQSLRDIDFNLNPNTYIELVRTDSRTPSIRTFREEQLKSWVPDLTLLDFTADPKEAQLVHFVAHIQPFITELQARENEKWRQQVTDVRNWSTFKAREYYRADKTLKSVYESSGSLSGGEGAQLAYTVLGAAIAHQFGIGRRAAQVARSFRFIVIDEAFSKLDEDKSKYLLNLCRSLGLQLMVVTPLTSLPLLEKDVEVIHWVTKGKPDTRKSVVVDVPIGRYGERKEALLAESEAEEAAAHD
ncbi:ATP-binding protein [Hymenobacter psoromatis]|uniref:ATP-binding protein n=1 Tax=Hymenobacter psoromatis TaxID=1484116 RepID=UPI001CBF2235|nr:SbcC/MukB-like Walker B domain-containing protein [Hymenobacter psoromatis]